MGVDMLNEPNTLNGSISTAKLQQYYVQAHQRVRTDSSCVLVHAPILDSQQYPGAPGGWESFMLPPKFTHTWHTWHLYEAYNAKPYSCNQSILQGIPRDQTYIANWSSQSVIPLFIGEWSLATTEPCSFTQVSTAQFPDR